MLTAGQREDIRRSLWYGNPFVYLEMLRTGDGTDYQAAVNLIITQLKQRFELASDRPIHFIAQGLGDGSFFYEPGPPQRPEVSSLQREGTMEIHVEQTQSQGSAPAADEQTHSQYSVPAADEQTHSQYSVPAAEPEPEPVEETVTVPEPEPKPVLETAALEPGGETAMLAAPVKKQRRPRSDRGRPRGPYKKRQAQPEITTSDQG